MMAQISEMLAALEAEEAERQARRARKPSRADKAAFYSSVAWKRLRYRVLAENARRHADGKPHCELCGAGAEPGKPFNVDHIKPLSTEEGWRRRLDPANCQTFCCDCNHGKLNLDATDFRPANAA